MNAIRKILNILLLEKLYWEIHPAAIVDQEICALEIIRGCAQSFGELLGLLLGIFRESLISDVITRYFYIYHLGWGQLMSRSKNSSLIKRNRTKPSK